MKKINFKHILVISTIIFIGTYFIKGTLATEGYYFRLWLQKLIFYYQYLYLFILFILIPFFYSISRKSLIFKLIGLFGVIFFLIPMYFFIYFQTEPIGREEKYTHRNGKKVISIYTSDFMHNRTRYYEPVNMFLMKDDPDNPDIEAE